MTADSQRHDSTGNLIGGISLKRAAELDRAASQPDDPRSGHAITLSLVVYLPNATHWRPFADALGVLVEQARRSGATVDVYPTPDDIDRQLDMVRAELARVDGAKADLIAQVERIESLNNIRRRADNLYSSGSANKGSSSGAR